ncbi:MAG: PaaI family thioesterase [Candidatus Eisenbacteria bacterium]
MPMQTSVPQDPAFRERVRASYALQAIMATLGAELTRVEPGEVGIELPYRDDLAQQHGFLHAGVLATVLDSACGYAAFTLMPAEAGVVSVEFKVNLLTPAVGSRFLARAHVVRAGRTLSVCQADGYMLHNGVEKHVALMTGTMMCLRDGNVRG